MPQFHYQARADTGRAVEGDIEAATADAAASQLMNRGVTPIRIEETHEEKDVLEELSQLLKKRRPDLADLVLFSRQMYTLTRAGVPIIRAINGLAASTRNLFMQEALQDIVSSLESGRDLANSLARHPEVFSPLFINIIHVGEESGRLDEAFLQISEYLDLERTTRERIKSATRYPIIVVCAIAIAIAIINLMVIPAFSQVFAAFKAELPLPTRILIASSDFTLTYWPHILGGLAAIIFSFRHYIKTERGSYAWGRTKLRIPIFGDIIMRTTLGRFARSFAMAIRSGVPLIQALALVARAVDNSYVESRIMVMTNGIERGDTLTKTATATGLFTPLVLQMLSVGEETGNVDDMMDEVAGFYEREVDYDLKTIGDAIEPILLVFVGIMVLVLALGVFLPMWELSNIAR